MNHTDRSATVAATLNQTNVHDGWEGVYRTPENDAFYDLVFDRIAERVGNPGSTFLDAGCGSASHSMRLADRGYQVCATDFSEPVVARAQRTIQERSYDDRIQVARENILDFSFPDCSFDNVLCWGVLMHIPEIAQAISELDRVLRPSGMLILSEGNAHSFQAMLMRFVRTLKHSVGRGRARIVRTPAGVEKWESTDAGDLLTRQSDIRWLLDELHKRGYTESHRFPGQFTEWYTLFSSPLAKRAVHLLNRFWFKHVGLAGPSFGNVIMARKGTAR